MTIYFNLYLLHLYGLYLVEKVLRTTEQFCSYFTLRNHYGETPVDSAFRSGKKEMIELMDKGGLLPRHDDPKLKNFIVEVMIKVEQ